MAKFWSSWIALPEHGPFTLESPWWISGEANNGPTICAAVTAEDEDAAATLIAQAHDTPLSFLSFRFINERPSDWSPFGPRFPKADWMKWPEMEVNNAD